MKLTLPNASSRYGAQMGRRSIMPDDYVGEKLRLTRLPFVNSCYDRWGAYWGSPATVWCAWGDSATEQVRLFVRGHTREEAKAAILKDHPAVRFFK